MTRKKRADLRDWRAALGCGGSTGCFVFKGSSLRAAGLPRFSVAATLGGGGIESSEAGVEAPLSVPPMVRLDNLDTRVLGVFGAFLSSETSFFESVSSDASSP